jgi:hypothetical protein
VEGIESVEVREVFDRWSRRDISRKGLEILRANGVA